MIIIMGTVRATKLYEITLFDIGSSAYYQMLSPLRKCKVIIMRMMHELQMRAKTQFSS